MNGRVYDPEIGRFMSVDPVFQFPENTQSLNPYSYVLNNPLGLTDPSGLAACSDTAAGSGSGTCTFEQGGKTYTAKYDTKKDGSTAVRTNQPGRALVVGAPGSSPTANGTSTQTGAAAGKGDGLSQSQRRQTPSAAESTGTSGPNGVSQSRAETGAAAPLPSGAMVISGAAGEEMQQLASTTGTEVCRKICEGKDASGGPTYVAGPMVVSKSPIACGQGATKCPAGTTPIADLHVHQGDSKTQTVSIRKADVKYLDPESQGATYARFGRKGTIAIQHDPDNMSPKDKEYQKSHGLPVMLYRRDDRLQWIDDDHGLINE